MSFFAASLRQLLPRTSTTRSGWRRSLSLDLSGGIAPTIIGRTRSSPTPGSTIRLIGSAALRIGGDANPGSVAASAYSWYANAQIGTEVAEIYNIF
jgi:hypothetical protein